MYRRLLNVGRFASRNATVSRSVATGYRGGVISVFPWLQTRQPTKNTLFWYSSKSGPSTASEIDVDHDVEQSEAWFELQMMYKDMDMTATTKARRLKTQLFKVIDTLPDKQFSKEQLPLVNKVVNFIDQGETPMQFFNNEEMITVLRAVLPAMTLEDVHYMDFFPRFYTSLRDTKQYANDKFMRMQLFEIFLNYVLLSDNRRGLVGIIDAFIDEEATLRHDDVRENVVDIVLEAFKTSVQPDMATVVRMAQLCNLKKRPDKLTMIMSNFFTAADNAISENYESNDVTPELLQFLDVVEQKLNQPLEEYIDLLYFSMKNSLDECCVTIMQKLSVLTDQFTDTEFTPQIQGDELMAIVASALKLKDYDMAATKLIEKLEASKTPDQFSKGDWTAYLQYKLYMLPNFDPEVATKLVESTNEKLLEEGKDFSFTDTDAYNSFLEALCWSNKPIDFIRSFSEEFDSTYSLARDSRSFSLLINHFLDQDDVQEAVKIFDQSLQESVAWDDDFAGAYMPTLFRLLADYFNKSKDELYDKANLYKKIKVFEFSIDQNALEAMVREFLKGNFVGDAMEIFEREVPKVTSEEDRYLISDYPKVFELYYRYAVTSIENLESNWLLYQFLAKHFAMPYEYYPAFLKYWIDVGYPDKALRIFADMKTLAKKNLLEPLREEIYIYLLQSFTKFQYEEGIFALQLGVKMDLSINLDIKLLNALMEGFCSLEDPFKVRDMFNQAQALPASYGLNNESCYWALKSLKYATLGEVNDFYYNLSQYDVLPDPNIFGEYLIANCYYEQYGTAYDKLVEAYETGDAHLIDRGVLKNVYNFCLNKRVRARLDKFGTEKFPKVWEDLKNSGELTDGKEQPSLLDSPYNKIQLRLK